MGELLHLWALAPATVGACCVAADRGRPRVLEFVAAVLMAVGMADVALGWGILPAVAWSALLVALAMLFAALRNPRRADTAASAEVRTSHGRTSMTVMTGGGLVVMGVLLAIMPVGVRGTGSGHVHGGVAPGILTGVAAVLAIGYVVAALLLSARRVPRLDRVQYVAMGASTALMAAALT